MGFMKNIAIKVQNGERLTKLEKAIVEESKVSTKKSKK